MFRLSGLHRCAGGAAPVVVLQGECVLKYFPQDKLALLSLERHARKNAIGVQLLREMRSAVAMCRGEPANNQPALDVRCLVLQSAVKGVFCAGADLKERKEMSVEQARAFVDSLRQTFSEIEDLEIPTISSVEGKALGGGMELALATDLRIAGDAAVMGFPETGLAIIPGAGGTVRAPALMGISNALELILSAEPVGADRARELGMVNRVVPAGTATEAALQLARRIAENGPVGVKAAKAAVRNAFGLPRDAAMAQEHRQYERVLASKDRLEGLKAFAEKRKPQYNGE